MMGERILTNQHVGRFSVTCHLIRTQPGQVVEMMRMLGVVIVRAELLYQSDAIEYIGLSLAFDKISDNCEAPEYRIICHSEKGKLVSAEAEKM